MVVTAACYCWTTPGSEEMPPQTQKPGRKHINVAQLRHSVPDTGEDAESLLLSSDESFRRSYLTQSC